jgi:hypothetical protein
MGRKRIYNPETLEVGESLQLKRNVREFADQYASRFRKDYPGRGFKVERDGNRVLIKRIA